MYENPWIVYVACAFFLAIIVITLIEKSVL
jgi:hypothetical protein